MACWSVLVVANWIILGVADGFFGGKVLWWIRHVGDEKREKVQYGAKRRGAS